MGESLNDLAKVLGIGGASTLCRVAGSKMLEEGDEEGYKEFKRAYGRSRFWPKAKSPKRKTAKAKTKTTKKLRQLYALLNKRDGCGCGEEPDINGNCPGDYRLIRNQIEYYTYTPHGIIIKDSNDGYFDILGLKSVYPRRTTKLTSVRIYSGENGLSKTARMIIDIIRECYTDFHQGN